MQMKRGQLSSSVSRGRNGSCALPCVNTVEDQKVIDAAGTSSDARMRNFSPMQQRQPRGTAALHKSLKDVDSVPPNSTMTKEIAYQLNEYGQSLHNLLVELPDHPAITDTLDYVLGALYGLVQAHKLGFKDRFTEYVPVYRPHLAN